MLVHNKFPFPHLPHGFIAQSVTVIMREGSIVITSSEGSNHIIGVLWLEGVGSGINRYAKVLSSFRLYISSRESHNYWISLIALSCTGCTAFQLFPTIWFGLLVEEMKASSFELKISFSLKKNVTGGVQIIWDYKWYIKHAYPINK